MPGARACVSILAAILAACTDSSGVTLFGSIGGFTQDAATGVALAGVTISVGERSTVSEQDGIFRIDQLAPGEYTVKATFGDFEPFFRTVTVHARQTTSVPVLLVPGGFALLAPDAIAAQPGDHRRAITVSWTPLAEATSYALYWSDSPDVPPTSANRIGGVTSPFKHTQLDVGRTYYYAVAGIGLVAEGPASPVVSSVPYDKIAIEIDTPAVGSLATGNVAVSVRVDSDDALASVAATLAGVTVALQFVPEFFRWQGTIPVPVSFSGAGTPLTITATDVLDRTVSASRMLKYPN